MTAPPPPDAVRYTGYGFPYGTVTLSCSVLVDGEEVGAQYAVPAELWADSPATRESVRAHVMRMLADVVLQRFEVSVVTTVTDPDPGF